MISLQVTLPMPESFCRQGDVVKAEQLVEASHRVFDIQNSTDSAKVRVVSGLIGGVLSAAALHQLH